MFLVRQRATELDRLKQEMRRQGKIAKWNDERGFGFISSSEGRDSIFVHISAFPGSDRRPSVNEAVSYTLAFDSQGRPQANDVRFIVGRSTAWPTRQIPRSGVTAQITFAMSFLFALAALTVSGWLEMSWLALYYVASMLNCEIEYLLNRECPVDLSFSDFGRNL